MISLKEKKHLFWDAQNKYMEIYELVLFSLKQNVCPVFL